MTVQRSRKAEVYWRWLRKCTIWVQLLPWRWNPMIKFCVTILSTSNVFCTEMTLKFWLESVLTYNLNFVAYLGYRNITCFPYRPSLRFQAQVPSIFYAVCLYETSIQIHINVAGWRAYECFNFKLNLVISKGRGLLV